MSPTRFDTDTERHTESPAPRAIRVTIHRALPRATRRAAVVLMAFAIADFTTYVVTGAFAIDRPYCYFSLILGGILWLSEGNRDIGVSAAAIRRLLRRCEANRDLDALIRLLLDR